MKKKIKIGSSLVIIGVILWGGGVWFGNLKPQTFPQYLKTLMGYGKVKVSPEKQIVFLGDSITYRENWNVLLGVSNIFNAGFPGDTTDNVIGRVSEAIKNKPPKLFLMIGTNDLLNGKEVSYVLANYEIILQKIKAQSPETKIYIESLLPINNDILKSVTVNNQKIISVNDNLKILAQKNGATYVDLYPDFCGSDNKLQRSYTWDGLHPNSHGYAVWKKRLGEYLN